MTRVTFGEDEVYILNDNYWHRRARRSVWIKFAVNRARFQKRIDEFERIYKNRNHMLDVSQHERTNR